MKSTGLFLIIFLSALTANSQIANFVRNGGFEEKYTCNYPNQLNRAKGWNTIGNDTSKFGGFLYAVNCYSNAPNAGFGYQYPHSGDTYYRHQNFCINPCQNNNSRAYPKNRLKTHLIANRFYCVTIYISLQNNSPYATSNMGFYFGGNNIDTITYPNKPITYLSHQVINPPNNIISDTLNWIQIRGTFVADGTEKYLVFGNFNSNAATTTSLVGTDPTYVWSEYYVDDVSCIDTDLPAFAGNDTACVPGTTVYLGRQRDIGIDEACIWYQLPNMTMALDTAAGITVSPLVTTTYVVRQEICGNVKWDTVVVHQTAVGLKSFGFDVSGFEVYPVPADEILNVKSEMMNGSSENVIIHMYNSLGQLLREEEINFKEKNVRLATHNLPEGVYVLQLKCGSAETMSKRFVIAR